MTWRCHPWRPRTAELRFRQCVVCKTVRLSNQKRMSRNHGVHVMKKSMKHHPKFSTNTHPAGGWGSVQSLGRSLSRERVPISGTRILLHQNKPNGFACVSCSWAKPANANPFEFCEEGAKATTWEITSRRCTPEFFAEHTVTELESWSDHALEEQGRLTEPLRWNASTDKYEPVAWEELCAISVRSCGSRIQNRWFSTVPAAARSKAHTCMR